MQQEEGEACACVGVRVSCHFKPYGRNQRVERCAKRKIALIWKSTPIISKHLSIYTPHLFKNMKALSF